MDILESCLQNLEALMGDSWTALEDSAIEDGEVQLYAVYRIADENGVPIETG